MRMALIICTLLASQAVGSQQFSFSARGRTYTVKTTKKQLKALQFDGHWLYQPSVITPSSLTGGQYVMLFNSNLSAYSSSNQAIFMSTSSNGYSGFSTPQAILYMKTLGNNIGTSNICDMIDARPYWDGSNWHVYVQAREWSGGACNAPANYIFEAQGSSLSNLTWVYDSDTRARRIVSPRDTSTVGIGEDLQWFYTYSYLGPPTYPVMAVYNDWGYQGQDCRPFNPQGSYDCYDYCPDCAFNGSDMFSYLSSNGTYPIYFWYYRQTAYGPGGNNPVLHYPDVILAESLDAVTKGNPGIGFASRCRGTTDRYEHSRGVGFYPDPVPYDTPNNRNPQGGEHMDGILEGWTNDNGGAEARMFRPRLARNEHGYLTPVSSSPKTWKTFLYYNDAQIYAGTDPCGGNYTNWTAYQWFSVSEVEITEQ